MSYRQDFRRNVAPCTAVPAQEPSFSRTHPVLVKGCIDIHSVPRGKHLRVIASHLGVVYYPLRIWSRSGLLRKNTPNMIMLSAVLLREGVCIYIDSCHFFVGSFAINIFGEYVYMDIALLLPFLIRSVPSDSSTSTSLGVLE